MTSKPKSASASVPIQKQYLRANQPKSRQLTPLWRLIIPLLFQTGITLIAPILSIYTETTGKTVTLETAPVDPYDILRGNYVALDYNISRIETLKKLPGWNQLIKQYPGIDRQYFPIAQDTNLYVIMQGEESTSQAWTPMLITSELPRALPENQVALRGKYRYGSIIYGLEKYNIPKNQNEKINKDVFNSQQFNQHSQPIKIQIKVDVRGNAVPINMQIGNGYYQF